MAGVEPGELDGLIVATITPDMLFPNASALLDVATEFDVPLIEDAAGALGAHREGVSAGTLGRASTFSFNGNKILTAGGGGLVVTDDAELAARCRHVAQQARVGGRYRYDGLFRDFTAELPVDEDGLVLDYAETFRRVWPR